VGFEVAFFLDAWLYFFNGFLTNFQTFRRILRDYLGVFVLIKYLGPLSHYSIKCRSISTDSWKVYEHLTGSSKILKVCVVKKNEGNLINGDDLPKKECPDRRHWLHCKISWRWCSDHERILYRWIDPTIPRPHRLRPSATSWCPRWCQKQRTVRHLTAIETGYHFCNILNGGNIEMALPILPTSWRTMVSPATAQRTSRARSSQRTSQLSLALIHSKRQKCQTKINFKNPVVFNTGSSEAEMSGRENWKDQLYFGLMSTDRCIQCSCKDERREIQRRIKRNRWDREVKKAFDDAVASHTHTHIHDCVFRNRERKLTDR